MAQYNWEQKKFIRRVLDVVAGPLVRTRVTADLFENDGDVERVLEAIPGIGTLERTRLQKCYEGAVGKRDTERALALSTKLDELITLGNSWRNEFEQLGRKSAPADSAPAPKDPTAPRRTGAGPLKTPGDVGVKLGDTPSGGRLAALRQPAAPTAPAVPVENEDEGDNDLDLLGGTPAANETPAMH